MGLKWKTKKVKGRIYRGIPKNGIPGITSYWMVQYRDKSGIWKDTVNKSIEKSGKIKRIFG
jgi:hypothetical protein